MTTAPGTDRRTPLLTAGLVCFGLGLLAIVAVFVVSAVTGAEPPLVLTLLWLLMPLGLLLAGLHLMSGTRWWAGILDRGPQPAWTADDRVRLHRQLTVFRVVAVAEAVTWAGLLGGMVLKYLVVGTEVGVATFGPIHGAVFSLYVVVTLWVAAPLRWGRLSTVFALVASLPPFGSVAFERWVSAREPVRSLARA